MTHKFIAGISHWIYYVAKTTAFSDWGGWYVHERKREEREMTSECSAIIGWGRFVLGFWSPYYIIISICIWMWRCCCCCFCPMVRIWREYGIPLYRTRIIMDGCEMNEQRKLINWIKLSLWEVNDDATSKKTNQDDQWWAQAMPLSCVSYWNQVLKDQATIEENDDKDETQKRSALCYWVSSLAAI